MVCNELINQMNYHCVSLGSFGCCIHTPFSYTNDGQSIRVFVRELSDDGLVVYDGGDALLQMESQGCRITRSRLEKIRSLLRDPVTLNDRREIAATCQARYASLVLPKVVDAVLLVNHLGAFWGIEK